MWILTFILGLWTGAVVMAWRAHGPCLIREHALREALHNLTAVQHRPGWSQPLRGVRRG